jgi:hypothetical protein
MNHDIQSEPQPGMVIPALGRWPEPIIGESHGTQQHKLPD